MVVTAVAGLSYAITAVTIGTLLKVPNWSVNALTFTVYSMISNMMQFTPATDVSACESNSH